MKLLVNTVPNTLHFGNLVTGELWIQYDSFSFPYKNWSDFPVIILGWWLENIQSLITGYEKQCECSFMDGPYLFKIVVENDSNWLIQFIKSGVNKDICEFQIRISYKELLNEILDSAKNILDFCKKNKWESDDIKRLQDLWLSYQN
jgi:hypothetical protein